MNRFLPRSNGSVYIFYAITLVVLYSDAKLTYSGILLSLGTCTVLLMYRCGCVSDWVSLSTWLVLTNRRCPSPERHPLPLSHTFPRTVNLPQKLPQVFPVSRRSSPSSHRCCHLLTSKTGSSDCVRTCRKTSNPSSLKPARRQTAPTFPPASSRRTSRTGAIPQCNTRRRRRHRRKWAVRRRQNSTSSTSSAWTRPKGCSRKPGRRLGWQDPLRNLPPPPQALRGMRPLLVHLRPFPNQPMGGRFNTTTPTPTTNRNARSNSSDRTRLPSIPCGHSTVRSRLYRSDRAPGVAARRSRRAPLVWARNTTARRLRRAFRRSVSNSRLKN